MNNQVEINNEILVRTYIGNDYDKIKLEKFNWYAFLFPAYYLAYKKQFAYALCMLLIMIISSKMMIIGPLLVRTISGIYFNKFYIKLAKKRVKQLKEEHLNVDNSKLLEICKTEGAGSVCYCFFIVILALLLSIPNIITMIATTLSLFGDPTSTWQQIWYPFVINALMVISYIIELIFG